MIEEDQTNHIDNNDQESVIQTEVNSGGCEFEDISELFEKLSCGSKETSYFTKKDFYKYALKFYRDKSGKALTLSYEDNCYLVALTQQVLHGEFNPATAETLGVLDVVGRDRRVAWQSLGNISKEEGMKMFIERIDQLTPTFKPYIEAVLADCMEKQRIKKEEENRLKEEEEETKRQEEQLKKEEDERRKQEETKRQIQEALNQQTFSQFKLYAEQQFPGNPEQQAVLIRQLQEQHYQQYMQQVYQQQLLQQQRVDTTHLNSNSTSEGTVFLCPSVESGHSPVHENDERPSANDDLDEEEDDSNLDIASASMWTRRDIKDFKSSIRQEGGDSIIKIGHGETVTVRVPTHQDGSCLFWEFATDNYDIGFGVLFEWRKDAESVGVTVHVTDSDDDEGDSDEATEYYEEGESSAEGVDDIERLAGAKKEKTDAQNKPPQSVIIPVYRRDSHLEVYSGSHCYPGTGVYLLKFDNSYSLWRNKVLYYRVYYTQR